MKYFLKLTIIVFYVATFSWLQVFYFKIPPASFKGWVYDLTIGLSAGILALTY